MSVWKLKKIRGKIICQDVSAPLYPIDITDFKREGDLNTISPYIIVHKYVGLRKPVVRSNYLGKIDGRREYNEYYITDKESALAVIEHLKIETSITQWVFDYEWSVWKWSYEKNPSYIAWSA